MDSIVAMVSIVEMVRMVNIADMALVISHMQIKKTNQLLLRTRLSWTLCAIKNLTGMPNYWN